MPNPQNCQTHSNIVFFFFFLTFSYLIDFQKITERLFSLFGYDFISVDTQSKLKIHDIPTTHKTIHEGLIYKFVLGRVFIVIQRRIENPVKHLRWCFLQKQLTVLSRELLSQKATL